MLVCSYSLGRETSHAESINKASVKRFNIKIVVKKNCTICAVLFWERAVNKADRLYYYELPAQRTYALKELYLRKKLVIWI